MGRATGTLTNPRYGDPNQNQKRERANTMKKSILNKASGVLSIILALALVALTFTGAGCPAPTATAI